MKKKRERQVEVIYLRSGKDRTEKHSCYGHGQCYVYGPAKVTTTTWPDGGIHQLVENLPKEETKAR